MVHVLGINLPDGYVVRVSVCQWLLPCYSFTDSLVCFDKNLWCWTSYLTSPLRTLASPWQVQGQRLISFPSNFPCILFIVTCNRTTFAKTSSCESGLCPTATDSFYPGTASSFQWRAEEEKYQKCGPTSEAQDRIRVEEGDSGEYCPPAYDWKLRRQKACNALTCERAKHAK